MRYIIKSVSILFFSIIPFFGFCQKLKKDSEEERMYGELKWETKKFEIPLSEITNKESEYYFQKIADKFLRADKSIISTEIIALTTYSKSTPSFNPLLLDSLAEQAYTLNENKSYNDAIKVCEKILSIAPDNITGLKEIALAYKRIKNDSLSNVYFSQMRKVINAIFEYGDGTYQKPFITNNFFEGISIYEAVFFVRPKKMVLIQTKDKKRILAAFNAYSARYDEILIKYLDLTHYRKWLKKGDYQEEENLK